ncbi:leucine-rich repeat domain-containing protein [Neochlamydia sp. S13]|uniref:leucine-rich repeat domain-containing protein n=1 Tax=Neochlamydia sp. S13 TaxID=1353976 RepID=UPI000694C583|nr:leucine-rich repeat domain-containing protein [Neochlamydia sp. S13]BBI17714.1 Predicted protein [Neochlamydia sp. S13]
MNTSSSTSIEHLPNEILVSILKACASPSLFSVCGRWRYLLATEVMPSLYKQIGKVHIPQGDVNKQALILDRVYKLEDRLSETAKVNAIFKQIFTLASTLSPLGLEFKWITEEKRYFTLANYSSYLLNINRLLLWQKLPGGKENLNKENVKSLPLKQKGELLKAYIEELSKWMKEQDKSFTHLKLSESGLTFLSPEIGQLSQLQKLYLERNQLTCLSAEIGQLSQLRELNLNYNQLTTLPAEIGQLSQLQKLYLQHGQLTSLPAEIGQLSQLGTLYLDSNQLTSLPAEIGQLSQLQYLLLSSNQLTSLPAGIWQLFLLDNLYLGNNQLTSLPAEIGQLSQLRFLHLERNQLTFLPAEIGQLSRLVELHLNNNHLNSLPPEIGQLLKRLTPKLNGNPLQNIPDKIKQRFRI